MYIHARQHIIIIIIRLLWFNGNKRLQYNYSVLIRNNKNIYTLVSSSNASDTKRICLAMYNAVNKSLLVFKRDCVDRFQLIFFQIIYKLLKTLRTNCVIMYFLNFFFLVLTIKQKSNPKMIRVQGEERERGRERDRQTERYIFLQRWYCVYRGN